MYADIVSASEADMSRRVKEKRRKDKMQTHIFHLLCLRLK